MPRKGEVPKRKVLPDPKFTDAPSDVRRRITKFINVVMKDGKKSTAEQIVYKALDLVAERAKDDPLKVWDRALAKGRLYGVRLDGHWMHVGTPEALAEAESWFEHEGA